MTKLLHKHNVRQHADRATGAIQLQYTGRGLSWIDRLYGFSEGTFFVALPSEIPLPEELEKLAIECGVHLAIHPAVPALRLAVAEALVADALVNAPLLLAQISEPDVEWGRVDQREVERKHIIAIARVSELVRQIETDLKIRRAMLASPVLPPLAGAPVVPPAGSACPEPAPEPAPTPAVTSAATAAVRRAQEATRRARENELPQRLPDGARRALGKMEPGIYAIADGIYDRKADMCSAMSEAQESSRGRGHEVVVVDWDGEWPVAVRRYGDHGRIIYRVEDALRRAGIEEEEAA